jgi:ribosomal protein S18 acetylase RimI-like enzyme
MVYLEFVIRNMRKDDIPHVQHIAQTSWNYTYEGMIPRKIQDSFLKSAYNDEMMKKRLESSLILVVENKSELVGFANFSPVKEDGEAELLAIYLHPRYHGNGVGTALLNEGIKALKGVKKLFVNVEKENMIGSIFYKAKGFTVASEFDDDFQGYTLKTVQLVFFV